MASPSGSANGGIIGVTNNTSFGKNTITSTTCTGSTTLTTQSGTRILNSVVVAGGGGGGVGNNAPTAGTGGSGGSGIVIIRFPSSNSYTAVKGTASNDPAEGVSLNLPNGSVFITSDTNVHYMWNGTDTWNLVA